MSLPLPLPHGFVTTRDALHRVATHVLARRRHAATGRGGLVSMPGGFGTPAFGVPGDETVLRITGDVLVLETRTAQHMRSAVRRLDGASLSSLAAFVGTSLDTAFSAGPTMPPLGDPDAALAVDTDATNVAAGWFHAAARALDSIVVGSGHEGDPSVVQLWPEHFDLAIDVGIGPTRVNLGASLGDSFHDAPYAYVGPWDALRPGDPDFWNAPFGALVGYEIIAAAPSPVAAMTGFFRRGLGLLSGGNTP
jgi:hypothetical protein